MKILNLRNLSPKHLFAIGVLIVLGLSFFDGHTRYDIPVVPDLRIGDSELPTLNPAGDTVSVYQIQLELKRIFPEAKDLTLADRSYQSMTHETIQDLIYWMRWLYWSTDDLQYVPDFYDCDNFARTFVTISDLAGIGKFKGQLTIVRLYTQQEHAWGGVGAGGAHALCAFRSDRGWYVYEPQTGQTVRAEDYPNRRAVWEVTGD